MSRTLAPITSVADCAALLGTITTDQELGRLEMVWKGVEAEIRRFCGQNIAQPADAYVDILPETDWNVPLDPLMQQDTSWHRQGYVVSGAPSVNGHVLPLRQGLVRSITSVYVDLSSLAGTSGSDFAAATLLDSAEYYLDVDEIDPSSSLISRSGNLIRANANWPTRRRSVKVTYVAGLTAAELDDEYSDIRLAVTTEILDRYNNLTAGGGGRVKSERLGDWQVTYELGAVDEGSLSMRLRTVLQPFVKYRFA